MQIHKKFKKRKTNLTKESHQITREKKEEEQRTTKTKQNRKQTTQWQ